MKSTLEKRGRALRAQSTEPTKEIQWNKEKKAKRWKNHLVNGEKETTHEGEIRGKWWGMGEEELDGKGNQIKKKKKKKE